MEPEQCVEAVRGVLGNSLIETSYNEYAGASEAAELIVGLSLSTSVETSVVNERVEKGGGGDRE